MFILLNLVVLDFDFGFIGDSDADAFVECNMHVVTNSRSKSLSYHTHAYLIFINDVAFDTAKPWKIVFIIFFVNILEFTYCDVTGVK